MGRLPCDLAACIGFYTRLPIRQCAGAPRGFAGASWASPLAGTVVGMAGAAACLVAGTIGLPPLPASALALAATMLVTGALHEDGLADTVDGLGGGRTRERKLEIMRDSRLGTYGACALLLSLLLRWSALAALADPATAAWALVTSHAAGRAAIPAFMRFVPPARQDGLAAGAGTPSVAASSASLGLGAVALAAAGPAVLLIAAPLLLLWWLVLRRLALRQVGGQTGDVLGCLEQGCEILLLLTIVAAWT
ncbi:MAG TPA: adenosylcobinamide-GDP ribazoletransferase [Geminicoccaceae bacterium]|nr:adenosylcobinamide-GDP ribazoletransferase [Geminicoccus sp.]HMU51745.1 adenosylcobinamide-GDP ribazoletransferase [Geminicoccaceae bacterium]